MILNDWSGHHTCVTASRVAGPRYCVQVLLPRWIKVDVAAVMTRLRAWRGEVEVVSGGIDLELAIPTGDLPLLVRIFYAHPETYASALQDALTWSRAWTESWDKTAKRCPA